MNNQWTFAVNDSDWENEEFTTRELAVEAAMREFEGEFKCYVAQLEDAGEFENVINVEEVWF